MKKNKKRLSHFLHTASLTAWWLHRGMQTSQSNSHAGEAMSGEGDEPESGGKRDQGSEREHMRSPAYYNCTDGAADEMGGIDG